MNLLIMKRHLVLGAALTLIFLAARPAGSAPVIERYANGLTVIAEHRANAPVTAVQLWVRAGSVDEEEKTVGLSHYLEHMLFKGTTTRPVGAIHEEIEKNGGEINAATSDDWTYYHISITSEEWRRACDIILDIAMNASFPADEVERERRVIEEELARRDDNPIAVLYDSIGPAAYRKHPYRFRTIGDLESLARTGRDELIDYYHRFYVPENMAVVIVGDFDTSTLLARIAETLGSAPARSRPEPDWKVELPRAHDPVEKTMPAELAYGAISYPAPAGDELEMNVAGDLLVEILTAGGFGRLRKTLIEELKWADEISVSFPTSRDPSRFSIIYVARPGNRPLIVEEIRREIRRLRVDGISQKELDQARDRIRLGRVTSRESTSSRAFSLGFWYVVSEPADEERYDAILERISTTTIEKFVERHLRNSLGIEVAVLPAAVEPGQEPEVAEILFQQVDVPLCSVGLFFDGGRSVEPLPGWGSLLAGTMNRGTAESDHEAFTRGLAQAGLTAGASIQEDMLSLIGTAEPARLPLLVDVLFDMAMSPNYADLEIVRAGLEADLRGRRDDPFDIAFDRLNKERWGNHPYGVPASGTLDALAEASPEKLEDFRRHVVSRGAIRVVVLGPIEDTGIVARAVAARLDGLGTGAVAPVAAVQAERASVVIPSRKGQAIVMRSVAAPAIGEPAYPAWKVANAVLGGRSSSRLFRIIREERGLAYAVGSLYPSRELGSQLALYAGTRSHQIDSVLELFDQSLYSATPAEVADAKRLIKGEFALDHELAARRVWYLGWYESLGLGAGFDELYPELIDRVTVDEVNGILEKIRSAPAIEVIYGGMPVEGEDKR